jgi:hypothetical protein
MEVKIISFTDTKVVEENGEIKTVPVFIPQCCLLNLPSCPHTAKQIKKPKTNIGL